MDVSGRLWLVSGGCVPSLWHVSGLLVVVINLLVASGWLGSYSSLAFWWWLGPG